MEPITMRCKTPGWIMLAAMSVGAGCGVTTGFTPTNVPPHAMQARSTDSVALFTSSAPTRPFVEVGLLSSAHASQYSTSGDEEVILALRTKAAEVGCDGVVMQAETGYVSGQVSSMGQITTDTKKRYRAACIVYSDGAGAKP
jgi:hypothetical protein